MMNDDSPDMEYMLREITGGGGNRGADMSVLRMNIIQHLLITIFDWRRAYAEGDIRRRNRMWHVIMGSIKQKQGIMTLQEYFGGRKISRFTNTIDEGMANEYLAYVMEECQKLMDPRVKPTRIR